MKKKKNTRKRGLDFQRWIKGWLEERGWMVHNETPSTRPFYDKKKKKLIFISHRNDIFKCIDLIAKKDSRTLWIQATLHKSVKDKVEKLKEVPWADNDEVFVFQKIDRQEIIIWRYSPVREVAEEAGRIKRRVFYPKEGRFEL